MKLIIQFSALRCFVFTFCLLADCTLLHAAPPNILFIAIDDLNDCVGFLGGQPQALTPNMDKLAKKGVSFTNAHCPAPGCSPSRNALLFGVQPFSSGLYPFYDQNRLPKEVKTRYTSLPAFLKANGYCTFGAGKIHHRPDRASTEWDESLNLGPRGEEAAGGDDEGGKDTQSETRYDKSGIYRKVKNNYCPTLNPLEDHYDYINTTFGMQKLAESHGKPFFLAVGLHKPHLPFNAPRQFFDLYPSEIKPPRINPDDLDDVPPVGQALANHQKVPNDVRRAYLASISWTDYNVGRLLDALDASPHADNTIVVLWSDHGYHLGEKQHFRKMALWDKTTRTPFIIWDRREKNAPEGRAVGEAVSLINIYRTLAEMTGLEAPKYLDGFSLVPQLKNPSTPITEPAICTWGRGNYSVRDRDWNYIRYYDGTEELYDHTKDPDEWTNLAASLQHAEVKARLASKLPEKEAPLVREGRMGTEAKASADDPLKPGKKKRQPKGSPVQPKAQTL